MLALSKKRKLKHFSGSTGIPAQKRGAASPPNEDPRFQMDSDFSDWEADDQVEKSSAAAAGVRRLGGPSSSTPAGNGAALAPQSAKRGALCAVSKQLASRYSTEDAAGDAAGDGSGSGGSGSGSGGSSDGDAATDGGAAAVAAAAPHSHGATDPTPEGDGREDDDSNDGDNIVDHGGDKGSAKRCGGDPAGAKKPKHKKVLSKRNLERVKEASDRRGIVYISRIPPHMKPHKLRQLLEPFGDIGRVYCAPEDPALRRLRKHKGGNSGKNFTEGWVEFEDKRRAKRVALALNGQPIGGSKRSAYHYDLWNIKYLRKFKWDTLTEEINYQRAVREQRLVAEISAAKRERDFYLSRVDKSKAVVAIQERRGAKQRQQPQLQHPVGEGEEDGGAGRPAAAAAAPAAKPSEVAPQPNRAGPRFERHFGQRRVKADPVLDERAPVLADDVLGLLGRKRKTQQQ